EGAILLSVDVPAGSVLAVGGPGDQEVAGGVHRDRGPDLVGGRGGVDLELVAPRVAGGVVAAGEDAPAAAVLAVARPGDEEAAIRIDGHGGQGLVAGGGGVDLELVAQRVAGGVVAAGEDAPAAAVLPVARPRHHERAVPIHGDRGA